MNLVVFSKDRACQLHAFLTSFDRHVSGNRLPTVLFTASTPRFAAGYERLAASVPPVRLVEQGDDFKSTLIAMLDPDEKQTCFFVDDIVFRAGFDFDCTESRWLDRGDVACLSLRLSPKIDFTYTLRQPSPPPLAESGTWLWAGQPGDWGYPMSLDGHIFLTQDILPLVDRSKFSNPSTLESALAVSPIPKPLMACLADHPVLNIPMNRVQHTFANRHANGWTAEQLNELFLVGMVIDTREFDEVSNNSAHYELDYRLIRSGPDA